MINNQVFNNLDTTNFLTEITCQQWKKITCAVGSALVLLNFVAITNLAVHILIKNLILVYVYLKLGPYQM